MDDRVEQLLSGQYFKKYQEVMYSEITEKFNMTIMEVRVLLFFDNHGSRNTAKDLVKIFHFTKSNVSKAIDSLLLRGYLKKQYDDQDRRYIHLTVQPEAACVLCGAGYCQRRRPAGLGQHPVEPVQYGGGYRPGYRRTGGVCHPALFQQPPRVGRP